nr:Serine threonine protein kinase-related domain containing protein [Haemonchus contortus]
MLHLDVKPSNIYLSLDKRSCKLGDFGLAINLKKVAADWADDGDKNYMAPELLNESPTTAADMFSLGITMLEVTTPLDKDYFLDKDWDFESEDVIHPPSLRMKRKYDCTAFGMQPVRKRLVFDELEENELPSPKVESTTVGPNTSVFTRILDFSESPVSPPRKKARAIEPKENPSA